MQRTLDQQGRWRSVTVGFRMSPEENEDLGARVRLSGLSKRDYITKRLQCQDVVVNGNPRVYKALRNQMADILVELHRLERAGDAGEEFLSLLRLVGEIMDGIKGTQDDLFFCCW